MKPSESDVSLGFTKDSLRAPWFHSNTSERLSDVSHLLTGLHGGPVGD